MTMKPGEYIMTAARKQAEVIARAGGPIFRFPESMRRWNPISATAPASVQNSVN